MNKRGVGVLATRVNRLHTVRKIQIKLAKLYQIDQVSYVYVFNKDRKIGGIEGRRDHII